ncbi:hypothetical protein RFI_21036 [Reticulomyxa filosa]|uniref:Uncharacterized protein n=1 Tax=Reticulomyxa filosa TaxID=46433 RepID=X6MT86_RETFI|nr:hypothetical protein RFI_21036 [Reticulomyxa filosa]|eukprot:ETO16315.1 hypothetical protein RFI_21036 [Reticulomyxa filosa]
MEDILIGKQFEIMEIIKSKITYYFFSSNVLYTNFEKFFLLAKKKGLVVLIFFGIFCLNPIFNITDGSESNKKKRCGQQTKGKKKKKQQLAEFKLNHVLTCIIKFCMMTLDWRHYENCL